MKTLTIGQRVKFNEGVAVPFIGLTGIIISQKEDSLFFPRENELNRILHTVKLDIPTGAVEGWPVLETLAVSQACIETLQD